MNDGDDARDLPRTADDLVLDDLPTPVEIASAAQEAPGATATLIFFGSAEG
ncbi:MAG: hypothetical protein IPM54_16780 [Polyangiaceae bacterium]|nr:hypothetical protein [Polyangiaceae bacterium]